jgi:hypothetical protein
VFGVVNRGQDWFFRDRVDFSGSDSFSGFVFQGTIGFLDTGLVFQEMDAMVFLRIGRIGFFKGWNFFHRWRIKNGLSTFFQDIEFLCFSAFSKNCLHILVQARGCFITAEEYLF